MRSDPSYGYIKIELDQPLYTPGQLISGVAFVETIKAFKSNTLNLIVTGKEQVVFLDKRTSKAITRTNIILKHNFVLNSVGGEEYPVGKN